MVTSQVKRQGRSDQNKALQTRNGVSSARSEFPIRNGAPLARNGTPGARNGAFVQKRGSSNEERHAQTSVGTDRSETSPPGDETVLLRRQKQCLPVRCWISNVENGTSPAKNGVGSSVQKWHSSVRNMKKKFLCYKTMLRNR